MPRTIIDELRSRKADWKGTRIESFDRHFETLASFYGAARGKRDELSKDKRLSPQGVREALGEWLGQGISVETAKVASAVDLERKNIALRREHLAKPTFEPTDTAGALMRQEIRAWLRGLNAGEKLAAFKDANIAAAALEAPGPLSGLTDDLRAHAAAAYTEATAGDELRALEKAEEGLAVMSALVRTIEMEVALETSIPANAA